ncbi:unnamed protein product, partial [Brassica rapa]
QKSIHGEKHTNRKMASPMSTIKVAVVSTVITAMSLFVMSCVPTALDLSSSRFPILWSSFLSWLKPPYLFVIINVIIIVTSSKYFQSTGVNQDCEVKDVDMDGHFVAIFPPPIVVTDVDRSEVVCEEKEEEEITGLNNGGDELVMLTWKLNKVPTTITDESETKKALVSARFSHRKPVKVTSKGNNRKKASRVVKPKWHENTWKMMVTEELESTPLANHSWSPETLRLGAGESQPVLRESETFRDITNNYPMTEMSPSLEELNQKFEAFIKKGKEEMLDSLRLDKDVDLQARLISF